MDLYAHETHAEYRTSVEFTSPTNLPEIVGELAWSGKTNDTHEITAIGHNPLSNTGVEKSIELTIPHSIHNDGVSRTRLILLCSALV